MKPDPLDAVAKALSESARSLAASSEWERGHGRHGEGLAPRRAAALAEERESH